MRTITADLRMLRHSGIGRYLRNLFPLLLSYVHADKVNVLSSMELVRDAAWLSDPRVQLIETDAGIYSVAEQTLALRGALEGSSLFWVPHYNVPLFYRGRMVVTIHDLAPLALPEIMGNSVRRLYAKMLIHRAVTRAEAILTVSEFTASELRKRLNVPSEKISVTHPGIDASWPEIAVKHAETDQVPYVLYVGNIKPNKNLTLLLDAYAQVADSVPFRLVLAGRIRGFGSGDEAAIRRAEAMGDKVRFAGEVSDTELISLYAGASAFVLPSLYEGFGLPLLEAMKLRCPVLCSRAGSLPEVAGDAALYFDPHSAQELAGRLLQVTDDKKMAALRAAGAERIRLFSFQDCAKRSAAVFNRLLEEKHA